MKHTPPPWFVNDLRASKLRELGWEGEYVDRILICSRSPAEVARTQDGSDCIIARISFDNRPEELGESNLADAEYIVKACNAYPKLVEQLSACLAVLESADMRGAMTMLHVHGMEWNGPAVDLDAVRTALERKPPAPTSDDRSVGRTDSEGP